jgi:DNA-binding NtrC family response regulator
MEEIKNFSKKILLIDDEPEFCEILKSVFINFGYECDTVENGKKGLEKLKESENEYFLVILDLQMPVMSGLDFLTSVSYKYNYLEFIVLTGYGDLEQIEDIVKSKISAFCTKPIELAELKFYVERAKKNFLMRQQNQKLMQKLGSTEELELENLEYKIIAAELRKSLESTKNYISELINYLKQNNIYENLPDHLKNVNIENFEEL